MAKGFLVVFTKPVSEARESEFNDWYDNIHAEDVIGLDGFTGITRFRAGNTVTGEAPRSYLALYECDDVDLAYKTLMVEREKMYISDALDDSAIAVFYEPIFSKARAE